MFHDNCFANNVLYETPRILVWNASHNKDIRRYLIRIHETTFLSIRKRTIPTERPAKLMPLLRVENVVALSAQRVHAPFNLGCLDFSRYFFIQLAPKLSSRGWVDSVPDRLHLRKSGSAENGTRDL
jgi:hypothetical protein